MRKRLSNKERAAEVQHRELWERTQAILKKMRPQQTLSLWHPSSLGVDTFFTLVRIMRRNGRVQLVSQPLFGGREVQAVLGCLGANTDNPFYVIQIREDTPLEAQVWSFLHELVHIAFWQGLLTWEYEPTDEEAEASVELLAFQFLETCDYYAFSEFLSFLPPERVRLISNTP